MVATNFSTLTDGFQFLSLFDQAFAQCMPGGTSDKTTSYTLQVTDNGQNISLNGNALNTLTIGPASGFPTAFAVRILNKDTGRGKILAINGITSFILWPLQTVFLFNDNGTWRLSPNTQAWAIPAGTSFNVDNVNGSDSPTNDGLGPQGTSGAFLTIQNAFNVIQKQTAQIGAGVIIQLPLITSTPIVEQIDMSGAMPPGIAIVNIIGNTTTPINCQWAVPANGTGIAISDYNGIAISGIGFSSAGPATLLSATQFAIADFANCDFGANPSGVNVAVAEEARVNIISGNSISGNCGQFLQAGLAGSASLIGSLKIVGTPNVGILANAFQGGKIALGGLAFSGAGTISGQQFLVRFNGVIAGDSGVSWPVSMSAGVASLGGTSDSGITSAGAVTFANLPKSPVQGTFAVITDSTTNTWGATISTGAGTITVMSWFNNSVWTVMGK